MFHSYKYSPLTTLFLLLFICGNSIFISPAFGENDPERIAKEYFKNGEYLQALPLFKDLVDLYPKDIMLNYYYAACLIENENFTDETKVALQNAFGEDTPAKIFYYQGQVFHVDGDFEMAASFYNRFLDEAKRKVTKETRVEELIVLCEKKINPFSKSVETSITTIEEANNDTIVEVQKPSEKKVIPIEIPSSLKDSIIHFQISPSIHYLKINQFKDDASVKSFIKGWLIEQDIEKKLKKTNKLREEYSSASGNNKIVLTEEILRLEKESYNLNQQLNKQYLKARKKEISYWDKAKPSEISDFQRKISNLEDSITNAIEIKETGNTTGEILLEITEEIADEILPETVQTITDKVVYKIQIGAYRKSPPEWVQSLFKKLSVIRKIDNYTDEKGVAVYTVGELTSFQDALQMQAQVRQEGVKDAFVAAYKNEERISVKEARKLTE